MLFVVAEAEIAEHNRASFEAAGGSMVRASRAETGCLGYDYAWDILEPQRLRVLERWRDAEALRIHFRTPHMAAFLKAIRDLAEGAPKISVFEASGEHAIGVYAPR